MSLDKMREDAERAIRRGRGYADWIATLSTHQANCSPERIIALIDAAEALRAIVEDEMTIDYRKSLHEAARAALARLGKTEDGG